MFQSEDELHPFLESKKQLFQERNLPCPPLVVSIGTLEIIEKSLVCVNGAQYVFTSPLKAVDVCFKVFWGLGCKYPVDSQFPWVFLENFVYGIRETTLPNKVSELMIDLQRAAQV